MTQSFIMIIAMILLGYLMKRLGYFTEQDGGVIARIIFNMTLPSLVIVTLSKVEIVPSLMLLPVVMISYAVIAKFLAIVLFLKYNNHVRGSVGMMASALNIGLFAYPLVERMFGAHGLLYFGMFDIGGSIVMFGITYFVGNYFSEGSETFDAKYLLLSLVKSVPLMTYMMMLTLSLTHIHLPAAMLDFFSVLSKANMPLSMLLLGIYLNFKVDKYYLPLAVKYLAFHYGFGALVGLACYFLLPFDTMFRTTLLIGFLLPVGVSIIPYAIQFKYRTLPFIGMVTNLSIIISIIILFIFQMVML
ncbi:AEC family transporter [Macrococcus equipercicus]|uniref:AEC family transporter n=1 Tax=Macrococcus equipercicus TaxID=69967 RepID=A0A9Q9BVZ4_9STAP|nr:AEC family transporter [Macrococcus equipercicus]KAA1039672.1 AEC family transporter [Macrococcus equipercicus]UTH14003.1 AEC family transporter [Macrococcus equipercicus]